MDPVTDLKVKLFIGGVLLGGVIALLLAYALRML